MKPKHKSTKPEEKPTNRETRVFSIGGVAPEDNPFAALLHLQPEPLSTEPKPQPPTPGKPIHAPGHLDLSKQIATVMRTSKGHAGKTVTLISGLTVSLQLAEQLLHHLKKRMGIGGTIEFEDRKIILMLQGDVRDRIQVELEKLHAKVKRAGG